MGFLGALTGSDVGKATMNAANQNKGLITGLQTTGNNIITRGLDEAAPELYNGQKQYDPYLNAGAAATSMYSNALGLNGAEGNDAATGAFRVNPGYEFARSEAEQAGLRAASAGGMIASGNTLAALSDRTQGLADQQYGSWLDRLSGQSAQGLSAANGNAQVSGAIANLFSGAADDRLGLESGVTQGLMGVNNQNAQGKEAQTAAKGSFLGNLISGGAKLAAGGLF